MSFGGRCIPSLQRFTGFELGAVFKAPAGIISRLASGGLRQALVWSEVVTVLCVPSLALQALDLRASTYNLCRAVWETRSGSSFGCSCYACPAQLSASRSAAIEEAVDALERQ